MFKSNIQLAIRQLKRNKVFSLINIVGLSLSMVACLLIFKYVSFEKSFDTHHKDVDQVYRIYRHSNLDINGDNEVASIFPGIAPLIKSDIPGFRSAARFIQSNKIFQSFAFSHFDEDGSSLTFNIDKGFFTDHDALDILGFDWVQGSEPSLQNPSEVVISESLAKKFFNEESAVGQILRFKNMEQDLTVTGVFKDLPANTHFKFDVLCSFSSLPARWGLNEDFGWGNFYTYVRVSKDADVQNLEASMNDLLAGRETWYREEGIEFKLQPIRDIHLMSDQVFELEANGNARTVSFLSIIGIFIMIIAWVNYVNLSTSKLIDRAKEVGVRKVLGSYKRQLIQQFMTESLLINFLSIALTLTLLQGTITFFESLLGIPLSFFSSQTLTFTVQFVLIFTLGALAFGAYPAVLFSRTKVTAVLKGKSKSSRSGLLLRRVLTAFQFAIALILIIGTMSVYSQLRFMENTSLGMDIEQTLIVKKPFTNNESRASSEAAFMNGVRQISGVSSISASSEIPGYEISRMRWIALGTSEESHALYAKDIAIDENYIDLYDIDVIHGRTFSNDFPDTAAVILNESAAKELLGSEDQASWINKTIYYELAPYRLVGIIKDVSQQSLKTSTEPQIYTRRNRVKFYSVKLKTSDMKSVLGSLNSVFNESFSASHFDYFFLDEYFNRQYKADRLFGQIFSFFSILAIIITILGLFGLSIYNIGQRTKEVSIRRVLGASFQNISYLLTKDYFKLILVASILAVPLAYFMIEQWLSNFANRMELSPQLFIIPILMVLVLALITVSYQVVKAALANPANSLRYE